MGKGKDTGGSSSSGGGGGGGGGFSKPNLSNISMPDKSTLRHPTAWLKGGDNDHYQQRKEHVAQPLSSLRDPASFGPPPKRGVHPSNATPTRTSSISSHEQHHDPYEHEHYEDAQEEQAPPLPSRPNRVGSSLSREGEEDEQAPPLPSRPSRTSSTLSRRPPPPPPSRRKDPVAEETEETPRLPPRPPRNNSMASPSPSPPPTYQTQAPSEGYLEGELNQGATSRLAKSGVSVPALGIGNDNSTAQAPVNELQARFARMAARSSTPSSPQDTTGNTTSEAPTPSSNSFGEAAQKKKAPPPPPPKKASIRSQSVNTEVAEPPPVPVGTKPR